jgi:hypothetical protein
VEVLPQQIRTVIFLINQKSDDSLHTVRGRSLTRMHPCRNDNNGLINFERTGALPKQSLNLSLSFHFAISLIGYGHNVNFAMFARPAQHLRIKVNLVVFCIFFFRLFNKVFVVLVRIRVTERKFHPSFFRILEAEAQLWFTGIVVLSSKTLTYILTSFFIF